MTQHTETEGIRPYGPGKYDTMLDQYVHALTLEGWCDEEVGAVDEHGWYGLIRGWPITLYAPSFLEPLNATERAVLTTAAGVIVSEDSQGFVHVEYFATTDELEAAWAEVLADQPDEDGGEV